MLSRRSFITGAAAAAVTAPAVVEAAIEDGVALTSIAHPIDLSVVVPEEIAGGVSLTMIRDLLLPGLWEVRCNWESVPQEWEKCFATAREVPAEPLKT